MRAGHLGRATPMSMKALDARLVRGLAHSESQARPIFAMTAIRYCWPRRG